MRLPNKHDIKGANLVMRFLGRSSWVLLVGYLFLIISSGIWLGYCIAIYFLLAEHSNWWWSVWPPLLLLLLVTLGMAVTVHGSCLQKQSLLDASRWRRGEPEERAIEVQPHHCSAALSEKARAVNCLTDDLRAENTVQQRFIADAAHQLRTPLTALQSQIEAWALRAQVSPEQCVLIPAAQVERLRSTSRQTTHLANQLLVLSRLDTGCEKSEAMQQIDLKTVCDALLEIFLDSALTKCIDLGLEVQSANVTGHEWLLRELISNLLDNAIKYTPVGGRVTLRCGQRCAQGGKWKAFAEVEDNGQGIDKSEYPQIVQRFYRVPGNTSDGSGLGLAIAQQIAHTHGALLSFSEGASRRGLKVRLEFPESA